MGIIGPYREAHSGISDRWQFVVVLQVSNPAGKMTNLSMKISNIAKHTISTRNLQKKIDNLPMECLLMVILECHPGK